MSVMFLRKNMPIMRNGGKQCEKNINICNTLTGSEIDRKLLANRAHYMIKERGYDYDSLYESFV